MDSKNAIEVRDVSKTFRYQVEVPSEGSTIFRRSSVRTEENHVIDGVSFDIKKGEVVGIIGRNGSGKSTLLSMIARIMEPDSGSISVSGKVASIMELGMGFHPDMSGRENIYLKGELYGFSKREMDERINRIIDYSGVGRYIDNPVRTYSSGMTGRLAFAIMVNVDSEVMLVDEVLSVGDSEFQFKAKNHFRKLVAGKRTVVIVSHNIQFLEQVCDRIIWLEGGKVKADGPSKKICSSYEIAVSNDPHIIMEQAEDGIPEAQFRLANLYRDGIIKDQEDGYRYWLDLSAKNGHIPAQVAYADMLIGSEVESDREAAIHYYSLAADAGDNGARMKFSMMSDGISFRQKLFSVYDEMEATGEPVFLYRYADLLMKIACSADEKKKAFELMSKAYEGYLPAGFNLALMYRDGFGTTKDLNRMEELLVESSEKGVIQSTVMLADLYFTGKVIPKDDCKAFEYGLKGAEYGNKKCQYQVATMYRDGVGVEKDSRSAANWFFRHSCMDIVNHIMWAADFMKLMHGEDPLVAELYHSIKHNPVAVSNLIGMFIVAGDEGGVDENMFQMEVLASLGNVDSQRRLINYNRQSVGQKRNDELYIDILKRAASMGDVGSMLRLADAYRDGIGVGFDYDLSSALYDRASLYCNVGAIYNRLIESVQYEDSIGTGSSLNKLRNLAITGNVEAMKKMGDIYHDGIFVKRDYGQSLIWYKAASLSGDSWAKHKLAEIYRDGKGIEKDDSLSSYWFNSI